MQNPNEYNDEKWSQRSGEVDMAIQSFWEAGASIDDIGETVTNALDNAGVSVDVDIFPREVKPRITPRTAGKAKKKR